MSALRLIFERVGFSNVLSLLSLFVSLTCFSMFAKIAYRSAVADLELQKPQVIKRDDDGTKVTHHETEAKTNSTVYENIVSDIDSILDNVPDYSVVKKSSDDANDTLYKIVKQSQMMRTSSTSDDERSADGNAKLEYQIDSRSESDKNIANNASINEKYRVQLAAFRTHSEAVAAWFRLKQKHRQIFNDLNYTVFKAKNESLYRLQIISNNLQDASRVCNVLKSHKIMCFVTE